MNKCYFVVNNGEIWIEIGYIDGKATGGRTWIMPNKISIENSRLLSLSIFETDKEE
ncbi:MAG: hypothetical protein N3I35_12435 [Clostridia bacterium]|nr:hypothetical protein [Clostridia bacterium]